MTDAIIEVNNANSYKQICIFKSIEDAKASAKNVENLDENIKPAIICVNEEISSLHEELNPLLDKYDEIAFVIDDDNFTEEEVENFSHNIDKLILQSTNKFISKKPLPNLTSYILTYIRNCPNLSIGEEKRAIVSDQCGAGKGILLYKNMFIKVNLRITENICGTLHFKRLTNYIFEINKMNIIVDNTNKQEVSLEIKITDQNGNTFIVELPAKNKYSLPSFKSYIYPLGNFLDCLTQADFVKILEGFYNQ